VGVKLDAQQQGVVLAALVFLSFVGMVSQQAGC
jgi:hypothetical protein